MQRVLLVVCWLAVAVALPGTALAGMDLSASSATPAVTAQEGESEPLIQEDQPEPDNTVTRIDVAADGTATWTLQFRTRLMTDEDAAEFERFQESFREDTSQYLDPFRERMTGVVANAEETTSRDMHATNFTASTSIQEVPRRWGVVTYRFEWHGFAAAGTDRVAVGDVFDGGFFIDDGDVLEIAGPDGYGIAEAAPTPDEQADGAVEWRGREDFADSRPRVVMTAAAAGTPPDDGDGTGDDGGSDSGAGDGLFGGWPTVLAGGLVLALILGGLYLQRARESGDAGAGAGTSSGPGTGTAETQPDDPSGGASHGGDGGQELVTDEDRVRQLLAERGGRMKQSEIVEALDWSKSKTSRVLSGMADDDEVSKLRLGRENVIDLEDADSGEDGDR